MDEFRDGDTEVIRAELPGVDPAQDVEVTVADGVLRIKAERRVDEMRYGSLTRTLPLPDGVQEGDIAATYRDGVLEIRVPVAAPAERSEPTRIEITA